VLILLNDLNEDGTELEPVNNTNIGDIKRQMVRNLRDTAEKG
jgi:hypothetical protein